MDEEAWLFLWILSQLGTKGDSHPGFSNVKVHGNHLEFVKLQVLMQGLRWAQDSAFLTGTQMLAILLVCESHFE